jgi:hypothetical protein
MKTPRVFVSYAPRGGGLRCAVTYIPRGRDVQGWFVGPGEGGTESAYFVLEDYYTPRETRYVAVPDEELHSKWIPDEQACHELARVQDLLAHEWLFYKDEPGAALQLGEYARDELAVGEPGIRHERLARMSKEQPTWTYYSPDFEEGVLATLSRHWPLDYRVA